MSKITSAAAATDKLSEKDLRAFSEDDQLAPTVFALVDKLCDGIYLLPHERELIRYGLTLLAGTKHAGLFACLLKLTRQSAQALGQVYPLYIVDNLQNLLLSVWDGNVDAVFEAIEDKALTSDVRRAWIEVLARLTFDGVISRDRTLAFLTRLERDEVIPALDSTWSGWEKAVITLGARDLEPALQRVWSKRYHPTPEKQAIADLRRAAADPTNPALFDEQSVRAIAGPADALEWIALSEECMQDWCEAEKDWYETENHVHDDPAQTIRLTEKEIEWLSGFLKSAQVPETTIPFETFDGFFTALVIGLAPGIPSDYVPLIWGTEDGSGPVWDSTEQRQYFIDLVTKHWNSIAARGNEDAPHCPRIDRLRVFHIGKSWAEGFLAGMIPSGVTWDCLMESEEREAALHILALAIDDGDLLSEKTRTAIIDDLPNDLRRTAFFWLNQLPPGADTSPSGSMKTGPNEPCPLYVARRSAAY